MTSPVEKNFFSIKNMNQFAAPLLGRKLYKELTYSHVFSDRSRVPVKIYSMATATSVSEKILSAKGEFDRNLIYEMKYYQCVLILEH